MEEDRKEKKGEGRKGISRRGFLKLVGAGALATAAAGDLAKPSRAAAAEAAGKGEMVRVSLQVNGRRHRFKIEPRWSLLDVLREKLGLTGPKLGCGRGP
jgi:xanthine dehydrogenase YagT iron-sulfur-binding subunit